MTNYVGKIIRGTGLIFAMTFIAALFSYSTRVLVARKLGPEDYGLFASVLTFILFFLFFRDLGLGTALVNLIAKARVEGNYSKIKTGLISVFLLQFASSSLIGIVIIALSGYLAEYYFKVPESKTILLTLVVYTITSILYTISKALLNGFQRTIPYSLMEPAKNLFILLFTLVLFYYDLGILAAAIPYAFVCVVLFFVFQPFVQEQLQFFKHKVVDVKGTTKELLWFGLPLMAADIGGKVIGYTDTLMLTYFGSLSEVGIYNVVLPSALFFIHVSRAISTIIFPISTQLHFKNDMAKLSKGVALLHKYSFALIIPLVFAIFAFADQFLLLFFGQEYVAGTAAFRILLIGCMFFVLASVNNVIISSLGQPKQVTKIIIFSAVLNVLLNIILIPLFGINGAAVATTMAYALSLILSTKKLVKETGAQPPYSHWMKLLLAGAAFMIVILYILKILDFNFYIEIIISSLGAFLFYVLMLYLFNIIDFAELKKNLLKIFKR